MITKFHIEGPVLFESKAFTDERGVFFESFNQKIFNTYLGEDINFVQDNISISKINVVRGLHFQEPPFVQGKLVRVLKGKVLDVAVDIRKNSKTYGEHISVELSSDDNNMFWVPPGFAHGFSVLEDDTIFSYKCTNFYNKKSEGDLLWNDSDLEIDWKVECPILSEKDIISQDFISFKSPF